MITLIPVGGLANRMKAIDAAIALAADAQTSLRIIWYKNKGLNARFNQLFRPFDIPDVELKEASLTDLWLYDRPRRRNLCIPRFFQRFLFDALMYEKETTDRFYCRFDFCRWAKSGRVYIASCVRFYEPQRAIRLFETLRPLPALQERIDAVCNRFQMPTYGVHVRRTDNRLSIDQSPTELFMKRMSEELHRHDNALFYLATDSEEVKAEMHVKFREHLITSPEKAKRDTLQGMQNALVEMYILSKTSRIFGSFGSSYSETAAQINNIRYEPVIK